MLGICFPTPEIGYACGANRTILKSVDGGNSWNALVTNSTENVYRICFRDTMNGFAGGNKGELLQTTNGGLTWVKQGGDVISAINMRDLYYDSQKHLMLAGGSSGDIIGVGYIYTSTNDGQRWSSTGGSSSFYSLASLHDKYQNSFVAVASGGLSLVTQDFGLHWSFSSYVYGVDYLAADFVDQQNGFAVSEEGTVVKSTDAGTTWNAIGGKVSSGMLRSIKMISSMEAFAAGANRVNVRTTDGGRSWIFSIVGGFTGAWNQIVMRDPTHYACIGENGTLYCLNA